MLRVLLRLVVLGLCGLLAGAATTAGAPAAAGFQVVPSPNVRGSNADELDGVASVSANEAWSVGLTRVGSGPFRALIEHWNGTSWSVVPAAPRPASEDTRLHGLAVVAANNVWAFGSDAGRSLIEQWNGSAWKVVPSPSSEPSGAELVAASAVSAGDIWAVGDSNGGAGYSALNEHWNGSTWKVVPSATGPGGGHDFLLGVAAISNNDVWAVGRTGRHPVPIIEHWNGSSWTFVTQPVSGYDSILHSISPVSSRDIWAVGTNNLAETVTEHWDGTSWKRVPSPFPSSQSAQNVLAGVVALNPMDVWAVGQTFNLNGNSARQPLAEHWDGHAWSIASAQDPGGDNLLSATAGSGAGQSLWAVGTNGRISKTLIEKNTG